MGLMMKNLMPRKSPVRFEREKNMLLSDVVTVVRRYEAGNFAPTSPKERNQAIKPLKTNEKAFFSDPG